MPTDQFNIPKYCVANINPLFIVIDTHIAGGVLPQIISEGVLMVSFSTQAFSLCPVIHASSSVSLSEDTHGCTLLSFPSNMLVITSTKVMLLRTVDRTYIDMLLL